MVKEAGLVDPVGCHNGEQYRVGVHALLGPVPPPSPRIDVNRRLTLSTPLLSGSTPFRYMCVVMYHPSRACRFLRRAMVPSLSSTNSPPSSSLRFFSRHLAATILVWGSTILSYTWCR